MKEDRPASAVASCHADEFEPDSSIFPGNPALLQGDGLCAAA
jgi:hypothetical protein